MSDIGNRIKRYEKAYDFVLTPRSCLFIRVDGRAFHTFTKGCEKPFDQRLICAMVGAAVETAKEMSGFKLAYVQSDECTFMLTDFDSYQTQGWFNHKLNKVVSLSASIYTANFNKLYGADDAHFDSRAFIVPLEDAPNVFIWRQQDWERNSIQMLARAHFSHQQCENKKTPELHEMLYAVGVNWATMDEQLKNGTFIDGSKKLMVRKLSYDELLRLLQPRVTLLEQNIIPRKGE